MRERGGERERKREREREREREGTNHIRLFLVVVYDVRGVVGFVCVCERD